MDRLTSHLKNLALRTEMQRVEVEEEEEKEKEDEETAESWLRRHLLANVSCDESAIDTFLSDAAPLIHLITSTEEFRALFIVITKNKMFNKDLVFPPALPTVHFDVNKIEKEAETGTVKTKRMSRKKIKESKEKKAKGAKTISRSRTRSKSKSPGEKKKKSHEKEKEKEKAKETKKFKADEEQLEKDRALAAQMAQAQLERETILAVPQAPETILEWHMERTIPRSDQFLFIVNKQKNRDQDAHHQLDDLFHVGYFSNNRLFQTALETATSILKNWLTFGMKLDILLSFYAVADRKSPKEFMLENFIVDCVTSHFCIESRMRVDAAEISSVQALLQPPMLKYCSNPEEYRKNCLLIQLSFFDVDLLNENTPTEQCAARLTMALGSLRVLNFLFFDEVLEWARKMFILLTDVFSTLLAKRVKRKCHILLDFDKAKIQPICSTFSETVSMIGELSKILFHSAEDQAPVEKLVCAFNVVEVLEEDIDEILVKVGDLHCEKRDTAMERTGIREAQAVLRELNEYLEENCMECAIESSNLESLRLLARNLSSFEKKLDGVMATLP